ncbi:hypothetical protein [Swingsia samuiensis]|uniref:Uncharacterized protein n=1 Tax=Swingsia samuiensis TaxID=1293412 RepID=A0A4Y6UG43_9PROT|nr:hypothetical protein [Swingsia samuiensis]QDH16533.1 hypothetical protein E3D00_02295 [Swingsia samuiensis]
MIRSAHASEHIDDLKDFILKSNNSTLNFLKGMVGHESLRKYRKNEGGLSFLFHGTLADKT